MKRILFTLLCSLTCGAAAIASEASDTIRVYHIDGKTISAFNGRQLAGSLILKYDITHKAHPKRQGTVVELHDILTKPAGVTGKVLEIKKNGVNTGGHSTTVVPAKDMIILLNGKPTDNEDIKKLSPKDIKSVTVLKAGSKAAKALDKEGEKHSYLLITTYQ